jgi:OOP family OmpA-OmpF porin
MKALWIAGAAALLLPVSAGAQNAVAPSVTLEGNRLVVPGSIQFGKSSPRLSAKPDVALDAVKAYLDAKPYISAMRIEGHVGSGSTAQTLSETRARWIALLLIQRGVDCKRLIVTGFGATKPVAAKNDPANTRIEFVNAALRGHPIGGMPLDGGGKVAGDACALN